MQYPKLINVLFVGTFTVLAFFSAVSGHLKYQHYPRKLILVELRGGDSKKNDEISSDDSRSGKKRRMMKIFELNAKAKEFVLSEEKNQNLPSSKERGGALTKELEKINSELSTRNKSRDSILSLVDSAETSKTGSNPSFTSRLYWNKEENEATSKQPSGKDDEVKNQNIEVFEKEKNIIEDVSKMHEMKVDATTSREMEEKIVTETPMVKKQEKKDKEENGISNVVISENCYISSGYWKGIDCITSFGLSFGVPQLRISRHIRPLRKAAAKATGLTGFLSGKKRMNTKVIEDEGTELDEKQLELVRRRLKKIDGAKKLIELKKKEEAELEKKKGRRRRERRKKPPRKIRGKLLKAIKDKSKEKDSTITIEDLQLQDRRARVEEIDKLIAEGQQRLQELVCEKDSLQKRPNPLYNYTTTSAENGNDVKFCREFNFPPDSLVDDYLDDMFATGRLVRMNHTDLWQNDGDDDEDDENIGDDLLTPSGDAERLYKEVSLEESRKGGGGSWFLRQSLGRRGSLGMKIGEIAEDTGYKSVCKSVMSSLAQSISYLHGMNIMTHSDIRLYIEKASDLPPIRKNSLPQSDYAQEAVKSAMFGVRKKKRKDVKTVSQENFIQRDAVVETLLSHVQISAPLLKLFPLAWQRALLANMITLITQIASDFFDGIELQFLGHSLKFSFKPISESDIIRHIGLAGKGFNHRRARPAEFEAAVRATAEDVGKSLQFLDRWHERALGSGMLRAQIANLIARLVLTLTDEILSDARMDLWAAQAGGPRVVTGLEYRTKLPESRQEEKIVAR